ncbi:MAG: pyruvate dehydrogenase (acetyl-transferring) E1 component subunit alpha [Candidatus Cardinium sp.]|uniref:pyruvate dehydrogenase (acetyl-transferring) E1 component subunit alpha n=1 Tax=Candidatus Cardinium sp. TP TaxID=2961955 RepID=UPI0021AF7F2D|nr:pyruvate dehydrogenase (acetyl-transferring) E1 component subunit alpha [Candidatus Cardinium sp. TP]MCT4696925.1 pyruvate dehydrogenase (acetyl-transferring) E1 component subunit alpha [Candidatus Cardinium sp. TP]MDN5246869.1 pyruvate dehydrogenase (acetyl-transferring) E1 component subunit alpha [Candidatus Cardinium sp.]
MVSSIIAHPPLSPIDAADLSPFYERWYELMLLIRKFEDKAAQLYGQQKIRGFCHLYTGQEACIAGAVTALRQGDKYITAYRDHAHPIALGTNPDHVMAELYGKATGVSKGYGGSMHLFDKARHFLGGHGIVGGHVPLGVGVAFAEQYKQTGNLCITFMGDGAVRQGAVHEAFNLAMLYKLPIIFVIENNGYAMGTSVERSSNVTELYRLGSSYAMDAERIDGFCVESVHRAVERAAVKARKGIPSLLEFVTYRYRGHSMSDPAAYRTKEEVESYKEQDPILKLKALILNKQGIDAAALETIDRKVKDQVAQAVAFAEASSFPDPATVYHYVYKQTDYPFLQH